MKSPNKRRSARVTSRIMSAIKSKDTGPERALASAMWRIGLRPVKHKNLPGTPDFTLVRDKVVVFCDGDFWHGNNWRLRGLRSRRAELRRYSPIWREKILSNIQRDARVSRALRRAGYKVLRFWESDILADSEAIALRIKRARDQRRVERERRTKL